MRIFGYLLLFYGFIVVVLGQAAATKTALHSVAHRAEELSSNETFTKQDVENAQMATALTVARLCRGSIIGPCSMLLGGVLLDFRRRNKKSAKIHLPP